MASHATLRAGAVSLSGRSRDLILPLAIVTSILVILVPLPAALMDLLLAVNITLAVVILLTTVYVKTPLELSIFPSVLLATTLARLVLNVATTRLILTRGASEGLDAAGGVVNSFSQFVAGDGKLIVGLVIFLIIVVIQFVVITKGATRISEVAARFALDGMPGRQMAIDADLNAGVIDNLTAQQRREEITRQADFYGAMDGASKFVRGDAVAGLVIMAVNIVGGLAIGVFDSGMSVREAGSVFTMLTIGDGLVSQVPAFLISVAAGLLVTRSTQPVDLPQQFLTQLFSHPKALAIAGGFLGVLIFTHLPAAPLMTLGAGCVGLAVVLNKREKAELQAAQQAQQKSAPRQQERIEDYLTVDPMEVEIGIGLIRLADPATGGDLLPRIQQVRQSIAAEIGIVMPKVRIRDNMRLESNQYRIKIADVPVAEGTLMPTRVLALETAACSGTLEGVATGHPAFAQRAWWIELSQRNQAESLGYRLVEPVAALTAHLTQIVTQHADEILTRDAARHLVEQLKGTAPAVVEELIPGRMSLGEVQQVLQLLLREQVPIRQLGTILEALGDAATTTKNPVLLCEAVRERLARALSARYRDAQNQLHVVTLDPQLEATIGAAVHVGERSFDVALPPAVVAAINEQLELATGPLHAAGRPSVVLCSPQVRPAVRQITESVLPQLVVLGFGEITRDTQVISVAVVPEVGFRS